MIPRDVVVRAVTVDVLDGDRRLADAAHADHRLNYGRAAMLEFPAQVGQLPNLSYRYTRRGKCFTGFSFRDSSPRRK